jgi:putative transposase
MRIARSTYYDRPEMRADDTAIVEEMFAICDEFEFYGYRRVGAALRQQGFIVNHKKIRRLMREHDLQPRIRRRFIATPTAITTGRSSPTWRRILSRPGPTNSGSPISPMSPYRVASFTSRSSSTLGRA